MRLYDSLVGEAGAYRKHLLSLKAKNTEISWYPYDTMANFAHLDSLITDEIDAMFGGGHRFADIGAADGDLAFYLESRGNSCDIYDFGATNYNSLRGANAMKNELSSNVNIFDRDLDSQFQFAGTYDITFLLGILYHLKNPFYILEQLSLTTRNLIVSTRVARHFVKGGPDVSKHSAAYLVGPHECNDDPTNYWLFTEAGLKMIFERSGWIIVRTKTVGDVVASNPQDMTHDERSFSLLRSRNV